MPEQHNYHNVDFLVTRITKGDINVIIILVLLLFIILFCSVNLPILKAFLIFNVIIYYILVVFFHKPPYIYP